MSESIKSLRYKNNLLITIMTELIMAIKGALLLEIKPTLWGSFLSFCLFIKPLYLVYRFQFRIMSLKLYYYLTYTTVYPPRILDKTKFHSIVFNTNIVITKAEPRYVNGNEIENHV